MAEQTKEQLGNWLQSIWWNIHGVCYELKACWLSFFVAFIGYLIFTQVGQGTEVLRTMGEGTALGGRWEEIRIFLFFVALITWAVASWYTARVLFYLDVANSGRTRETIPLWEKIRRPMVTHAPRVLGIAPILIVANGFLIASHPEPGFTRTNHQHWLLGFGAISALLAVTLYLGFVLRRRVIGSSPLPPISGGRKPSLQGIVAARLPRQTRVAATVFLAIAFILLVLFSAAPIRFAQNLGMGTIFFIAAASWVVLGGLILVLASYWRLPLFRFALAIAIVSSCWNDNHRIRLLARSQVARPSVLTAFDTWYSVVEKRYGAGTVHPLYVVATEGGGIRAAYWTSLVLGALQDANPSFADHVFAISGVSGGSLGATVFVALLGEHSSRPFKFKTKGSEILRQDFLSPALAAMLYPDFLQRFIPIPIPYLDRARALEGAWEKAWRDTMGNDRFAGSFLDLFKSKDRDWIPALLLNGTSVERGTRIITSNLRITISFLNCEDTALKLAPVGSGSQSEMDIPVSTAAHMSARFTFVSPSGLFPDGTHIVDGGYFENSGSTTAQELSQRITQWCAVKHIANVEIVLLLISNAPILRPPPVSPLCSEVTTPLIALERTRAARADYAQRSIAYSFRRFRLGVAGPDSNAVRRPVSRFSLRPGPVPFVLGWMLSDAAAKAMEEQLYLDDDLVLNKTLMNDIVSSLPAPAQR